MLTLNLLGSIRTRLKERMSGGYKVSVPNKMKPFFWLPNDHIMIDCQAQVSRVYSFLLNPDDSG